jgi:hypothetical protein
MSRTFSRVAALITASVGVATAAPQTQPPSFVAATRTVAVYATVTNAQGRLAPDLARDDFAVDDNGKRQRRPSRASPTSSIISTRLASHLRSSTASCTASRSICRSPI